MRLPSKKDQRMGETRTANNGQEIKIVGYKNSSHIDVQFEDGTIVYNKTYRAYIQGHIRNPNYHNSIVQGKKRNKKDQRMGETRTANNGQKMTIIAYRNSNDIDVRFEDGTIVYKKTFTSFKKGSKFKKDDVLAYDKYSFGKVSEDDALAYNLGALAKVAIMSNDEGFEDSTSISHWMSEALASEIVFMKDTPPLSKSTNIYNMVKVGDYVQEGEPLIIYQNAFDEEDANALLKSITDEDLVSDLGRIRLKAKYTGTVQDIKIYRTCEISEMSDTMAKIVRDYEKQIKATKAMYKKYNIPGANMLDPDYVMPQTGKLKNCQDGIIIEFYIKYNDKLGVGDKLVAQSANKGVVKDIFPEGMEPFTKAEPGEKIHALFAARSFNARMVTSPFISGAINKAMIELDKQVKDILGLKRISVEEANEHK